MYASGADLESPNPLVTVHPLSRQLQRHALLVTLVRWDSTLTPEPYYARRWAWGDGGRTLTMWLEPTLRWHDGTPTTAHDAAFTLTLARDPSVGFARAADLTSLEGVQATDDTTLVLRFATPQPSLPGVLCELPLVPRHLLAREPRAALRQASFERTPVGNGPFRFVSRTPNARWVLERNASFPASMGGAPRMRRLVVAVVDEPTTKFAGLVSGELDVAGVAPTMAALVARDPALRVVSYPVTFSTALVFNATRPPFDDVRVRQALSLALDRKRIVAAALAGYATPATSAVPPDNPLALPIAGATDGPQAARADSLLDAAGWKRGSDGRRARGGRPLQVELLTVGSGDNAVEQLVQADLAARGVRLEIRTRELGAFLAAARAPRKSYDLLLTGVPGDLALSHLAAMFATSAGGGALDYAGFHRPALDAAFARAARAATSEERVAAWRDAQRILAAEAPVAWLYHSRGVQGVARSLAGVTMDLRGELATVSRWHRVAR
ncbi:peptide-binding protein [Roseisolibacter agri]|uniref:Peptide-binding protein n=1 Tax=Roseisolibacter agri TaxID=2014610 RepID=A0AA37V8D0_9BACT|nr:peptide-binding protein [Roseisolibacter agri]